MDTELGEKIACVRAGGVNADLEPISDLCLDSIAQLEAALPIE